MVLRYECLGKLGRRFYPQTIEFRVNVATPTWTWCTLHQNKTKCTTTPTTGRNQVTMATESESSDDVNDKILEYDSNSSSDEDNIPSNTENGNFFYDQRPTFMIGVISRSGTVIISNKYLT